MKVIATVKSPNCKVSPLVEEVEVTSVELDVKSVATLVKCNRPNGLFVYQLNGGKNGIIKIEIKP